MSSRRVLPPHPLPPLKNRPSFKSHCLQEKLPLPTTPPPTPRHPNPLTRLLLRTGLALRPGLQPDRVQARTAHPSDPIPPPDRPSSVRQWGPTPRRQSLLPHHPHLTPAEAPASALLAPSKLSQAGPRTQPTGALLHSLFGIHAGHVTAAAAAATAALAAAAAALTLRATGSRRERNEIRCSERAIVFPPLRPLRTQSAAATTQLSLPPKMAAGEPGNRKALDQGAFTQPKGRPHRVACRERELRASLRALGNDGTAPRPGLSFPPSPAFLAHAYLRGCRPPYSPPLPTPPAPPLPAPLPSDSLARTSLGLPLADWLRPSGPGDVISETWQPGESAPHGGGEGLRAVPAAGGRRGWGSGGPERRGERGWNPRHRLSA